MQQPTFKQNLIAASVAMTLGVSGSAFAANSGEVSPNTDAKPSITNKATASYSVDGVKQPKVESNEVKVTISPVSQFSLVGIQGADGNDDKNEDQAATPGGTTTFINKLTNEGNGADTYTLTIDEDGNNNDIDTANPDYKFSEVSDMTVQVRDADGNKVGEPKTIQNNGTVTLEKGQYADITYTAKTPDSAKGGEDATLTLSATSEDITAIDPSKATLINESQAEVKLPVFKIVKTASVSAVNLNGQNPTFNYKIQVTNDASLDYTTKAVNALIQDSLPKGLEVNGDAAKVVVKSTDESTKQGTVTLSRNEKQQQVVSLQDVDIAIGETVTITIPVRVADRELLREEGSVTNNADVYDNYDDKPVDPNNPDDADIHDSTTGGDPKTDDDGNNPDQPGGDSKPPKVDFTDRSITLEDVGSAELPPTSAEDAPAKYEHTIVNNGNEDESGLKFVITDPDGDKVNVKNVTYDPTPDQPNSGDEEKLTKDDNGKYDIPGNIPKNGGKAKVTYDVVTDNATPDDYETTITLTAESGENDDAPVIDSKTDTTVVKEMKLVKEQGIDANCNGTVDQGSQFTKNNIEAVPGQCIVYKITAINQFDKKALTNVKISDAASKWNKGATYRTNSAEVSANGNITETPNNNNGNVKATFANIEPSSNGWVQFAVRVK